MNENKAHKLGCDEYHAHRAPMCCALDCWCQPAEVAPGDGRAARLQAVLEQCRVALEAAEQFLTPEIDRGPAVNGWQNTVDLVRDAKELALTLGGQPPEGQ